MFLNAIMLAGIGGAVVPLVLHLLARARYRTVDWGAMMFLPGAEARQERRGRIRQWVLLAIRMAIVATLAVALARPVVRGRWAALAADARTTAVIVLDRSASMGLADGGGRTRFDHARDAALAVLSRMRPGDQVALLTTGDEGGVTDARPTGDLQGVASLLAELTPSFSTAELAGPLAQAARILGRAPADHQALFVITDRQAVQWTGVDASFVSGWRRAQGGTADGDDAPPRTMRLMTVGGTVADNVAVRSVALVNPPAIKGIAAEVEVVVANHGSTAQANLPLTMRVADKERFATTVSLAAGESRTVRAMIPFDREGPQVLRAEVVGSVGLAADDAALAVVEVSEPLRVLIVSGDERGGGATFARESDFLAVALSPFDRVGRAGPSCAKIEVIGPEKLGATALSSYDVVVLANVPQIAADEARSLEQYAYDGGGVILAPGGLSRPDAYNQVLHRGGTGLLAVPLAAPTPADGSAATRVLGVDLTHPVFQFLRGSADPIPTAAIGRYFRVASPPQSAARVLATYASGEPFLIESRLGLGRVLLTTTPIDADWNTLPLTGFYLPYAQSLVRYAAGGALPRRNVGLGEELRLVMRERVDADRSVVVCPDDRRPRPRVTNGDARMDVRFAQTTVPGLYQVRLRIGDKTVTSPFVVNRPAGESDLTPLADDRLAGMISGLGLSQVDLSERTVASVLDEDRAQRELWPVLIAAVLGLVAVELVVTRWLGSEA